MARGKTAAALASLFAVSFVIYCASISYGYVAYDEQKVLLRHANLFGGHSLLGDLNQIFFGDFPREEPLLVRDVTWAVESRLFGLATAWPRHLGNVLLNALNAALAFLYLRGLTGRVRYAFLCVLAWSVLAIHVQPVCWVMGRKDVLSTAFALVALLVELQAPRARSTRARAGLWALGLLATVAALLSKISALSLFAVLILQRVFQPCFEQEPRSTAPSFAARTWLRALVRYAPHLVASVAIYLWYDRNLRAFGVTAGRGPGFSLAYVGILFDFLPLALAQYAQLLCLPFGFSISYESLSLALPLTSGQLIVSRASAALALVITAVLTWRRRDLLFWWLAFWALMATYLNLVYIGIWVADRYLYFSSLFLVALLGMLVVRAQSAGRALRAAVAAAAFGVLALNLAQVFLLQGTWKDNEALWTYETSLPEPSLASFKGLAWEYLDQAEAEREPSRRAQLLSESQAAAEAGIERYATLKLVSTPYFTPESILFADLHYLRGRALKARGAPIEEQLQAFQRAARAAPSSVQVAQELAPVLFDAAQAKQGSEQEQMLRRSLAAFARYAAFAARDPETRRILEANYARYPFLAADLDALREKLWGKKP